MSQEKIPTNLKPRLKVIDGEITTTSLDVAEKFGKQHKDVLKAVRNLECSEEFAKRNFALCHLINELQNRKPLPYYRMTRDGFAFLAMGFTGKEAGKWKEAYINAFSFMETRLVEVVRAMKQIEHSGMDKPLDFSDPDNLPAMDRTLFLRLWEVFDLQPAPTGLIWWALKKAAHKTPAVASYREIAREVGGVARVSAVHRAAKRFAVEGLFNISEVVGASGQKETRIVLVLDVLAKKVAARLSSAGVDQLFSDQRLTALAADLSRIASH